MFATFIPELSVLLSSWQLQRRYRSRFGERHVLVCGELTYRTIKKFVRHLFDNKHEPNSRDVFVVFLGECASLLTSRLVSFTSRFTSPLLSHCAHVKTERSSTSTSISAETLDWP